MKPNYELRVGLFTIIGLIVLIYGWGWLKSASLFNEAQRIVVRFHDVAGLNKNATVNINGVRVGIVEKIELKEKGVVNAFLKITAEGVVVTQGSSFTIQTLGMVGAKYIEITLPSLKPGQPPPPALSESQIVEGQDPVRVELIINELATKLSRVMKAVKSDKAGTSLASALEHSGEAVQHFNEAAGKLDKNMDRLAHAADSVTTTSDKFGKLADKADSAASNASTFFHHGTETMDSIDGLAQDLKGTAKKVNKILDNPAFSRDLKETAQLAKQTADTVAVAMHELSGTLKDEPLRKDVMEILKRINDSTEDISASVKTINTLSADGQLRSDVKQIVSDAKDAMNKVNDLVTSPEFKPEIKDTIARVRSAATNVDMASRQLSQVLNQRAPLLKMLFGRPGYIAQPEPAKSGTNQ